LFWLIIAPGLVLLVNLRTPIYTPRYTAYAAPAVGIIIGATLATIPLIWPRKRKVDVSIAHATSWIAVIVLAGISLYTLPNYLPVRVPLRHIYREMNQLSPAGTVLYTTHIDPDGTETDQMVRYLAPAIFENQAATLDEAIAARYVWFVTEHWFENATRVQFQQLAETHRVQQVVGDCKPEWCYLAQLMVAPPQREPTLFGDIIGFHGADVTITDKAIHALLWWSVNGQPTQDYSISLQLLDASGALVAQVDRQIKPPDFDHEIPTSQMQPDNSYIDARDLLLPDGLPAGEYMLQLVVYRWQDNTRLTLPDGRDTLPLQKVRIE